VLTTETQSRVRYLKSRTTTSTPHTGLQRQLWCLAISAKRYALFVRDETGEPQLLRQGVNNHEDHLSEHGLGHLLNPSDPDSEDPEWISRGWLSIVRRALDLPTQALEFESKPAVGRVSVSSPHVFDAFKHLNKRIAYAEQIKPFNFLLSCHVRQLGHPAGTDPARFHLVAPFENDPRKWTRMSWIDQYSGRRYKVTVTGSHGSRGSARVKTHGEVLREYEFHPEAKCADSTGRPCGKQTKGLLQRRRVRVESIKYVGKESNQGADVNAGAVHDARNAYTYYPDPKHDEWAVRILPMLRAMPMKRLQQLSGMSRASLQAIRARRSPHERNRLTLMKVVCSAGHHRA